ncbi:MAG: GDP-mannose 4,6-dehydratase [Planctomycetota bacterium]|nr:GDP-mannose 4,6-dehydratase [Planctomycetota bacterium]
MQVLITGGAGFIGSHLAEKLLAQSHVVTVIDDLSTGSMDNISHLMGSPGFRFVRESVRNEMMMTALVERTDMIYHLAAAVGVQLIVDRPVHTIETNIHGSEVVLSLANKFRTPVLIASTSEVYGKSDAVPFREDADVVYGCTAYSRWSYAASKAIDEFLALAYYQETQLPVVICRFFNTVGPRQTGAYGMVVPRFVQAALRNEPIRVFGTGEQSRCFACVFDVVDAVTKLMVTPGAAGGVYNIGSTESVTIRGLAEKIIEMTGSRSAIEVISYEQAYGRNFDDMMRRVPDLGRIEGAIGYRPRHNLTDTLKLVIEHERAAMARR